MNVFHRALMLAAVALTAGSAPAADVIIKDSHLKYNGKNYFRGGAESVSLGSYGEKKTPLTSTNYLEVQGHVPYAELKVRNVAAVTIDFKQTSEKDFTAGVKAGAVGGSLNTAYADMKSGKLKMIKLEVEPAALETMVNTKAPKALDNLKSYGNDARIAHQIFVVLDGKTADKFVKSTKFEASAVGGALTVKGSGGAAGDTTVTFNKSMTYAYLLLKIEWKKNTNKPQVEKFTDDMWSFN